MAWGGKGKAGREGEGSRREGEGSRREVGGKGREGRRVDRGQWWHGEGRGG